MPEAISRVMAACLRKEMSRRRFRSWLTPDLEREELEFALLAELALLVELDLLDDLERFWVLLTLRLKPSVKRRKS